MANVIEAQKRAQRVSLWIVIIALMMQAAAYSG